MTLRPRRLIVALGALVVAIGAVGNAYGSRADIPTLYVAYSSNCTFTITGDDDTAVTSIAPGDYQVQVTTPGEFGDGTPVTAGASGLYDCDGEANFELTGQGNNVTFYTNLDNGSNQYELLTAQYFPPSSTFVAKDENNPASVVSFTTTASGTPIAASGPASTAKSAAATSSASQSVVGSAVSSAAPTTVPARGTLEGAVSATGKLSLSYKGKSVKTLLAGRYTLTIADHSTHASFLLRSLDHATRTITTSAFTGTRRLSLTLTAGEWSYSSNLSGTKTDFVVRAS